MWDATMFGVFNDNFPLYIKHEDLSVIIHSVHIGKWSLFCLRKMLSSSFSNNYLKRIINKSVVLSNIFTLALVRNTNILIVQYASMFVLNSDLKGFDNTPQSKFKTTVRWIVCNRQKGSTECGYYIMRRMLTIILRSFNNNWEIHFNDATPLKPERLKALCIQWASYYLKVKK
ncbi:hypothetical protein GmHk_01G001097 [Glycine max]|nr:hypothetical protein GmHk_01G001097 [Glycine max]